MDSHDFNDEYVEASTQAVQRRAARPLNRIERTIQWSEFSGVQFLAQGTGTSLYIADLWGGKVVIKAPNFNMTPDEINEITTELKLEARILRKLNHPRIISIYGTGMMPGKPGDEEDSNSYFFVALEYLDGGTLFDHLKACTSPYSRSNFAQDALKHPSDGQSSNQKKPERMEIVDALRIGEDLADALRYLHEMADDKQIIIHRDLKPDNIGFLADGTLRLFDFGLTTMIPRYREDSIRDRRVEAGEIAERPRYRMTGHTGSVRYMAPEVALDMAYNESVDMYSFSVVLWEIVCNKKPYSGMNVRMHRVQVCEKRNRPALSQKCFSKRLASLLKACWAHDMDARPDFTEALRTLRDIRRDEETPNSSKRVSLWSCIGLRK